MLVYTYFSEMYDPEHPDKLPQSIAELEQLAEHYCISSVYMAQAVYRMAEQVTMPVEYVVSGRNTSSGIRQLYLCICGH